MNYYKIFENYTDAENFVAMLEEQGIKRDNIDIVMKSGATQHPSDMSAESLTDDDTNISDSPEGTTRALGATGTFLAGITASLTLVAVGPVAAAVAGGAVGAATLAAVLKGYGVPEEDHSAYENKFSEGNVLVHVQTENKAIAQYFD